jgi:hypothetical protein
VDVNKASFIVHFDRIMVNAMETNSGIFVGTNSQYGWSSHNKTNASVMGVSGDNNTIRGNLNVIYDNDLIDTSIDDRDVFINGKSMNKAS